MLRYILDYFKRLNWNQQISFLLIVSTFILIVLGSLIRLNHAGLSCPDWPLCYGLWLLNPSQIYVISSEISYNYNQIIFEWIHRIFAITIILSLVIFLLIENLRYLLKKITRKTLVSLLLTFYGIFILLIQIGLGSVTIAEQNINWSVAIHLLNALLFYDSTILIYVFFSTSKENVIKDLNFQIVIYLILITLYFNIATGAMLSISGVSSFDISMFFSLNNCKDPFSIIYFSHILSSILLSLCIICLYFFKLLKSNHIRKWVLISLFLLILNCILGYANLIISPVYIKSLHQIASLLLFTIYSYIFWRTKI